jgi:hypothetical protein
VESTNVTSAEEQRRRYHRAKKKKKKRNRRPRGGGGGFLRAIPYERTSGWSSKASEAELKGVEGGD